MCGICGIAFQGRPFHGGRAKARVKEMLHALRHRGPDASGLSIESPVALGASRLAIRGLDSGRQPLRDDETGVMVVCNGEIDNHRELRRWLEDRGRIVAQQTDIAVLPGLYLELGEKFVEKLAGVFAIAVWDPRRGELFMARDRAGERPLFFSVRDGVTQFATEVSALVGEPGAAFTCSKEAIGGYLFHGCLTAPASPYAEVRKVHPGEIVTLGPKGIRTRRYWRWAIGRVAKAVPAIDVFDGVFREAVRRQSDIDVPFGILLSGGLDSSLVAAVARDLRPQVSFSAYSLRFEEESYDEGAFAKQVARDLGLESVSVWVRPSDLPGTLADLVARVGEPLADPAWIPTALLARRAARDVKLVLSGEGADELFGGYPTHLAAAWGEKYARLPQGLHNVGKNLIQRLPVSDKKVALSFLLKRFVVGMHRDGLARHALWNATISPAMMVRLGFPAPPLPRRDPSMTELLDAVQCLDLETTLAEGLLTKSDRAGMRSALEVRAPFLDQGVMEFAATLPAGSRVRGLSTKVFLKKYAERYLARPILYRRKRGLSVPLAGWLRGPLYEWARFRLSAPVLAEAGIHVPAALEILGEHRRRESDHARAIWALIVLSEWLGWDKARTQRSSLERYCKEEEKGSSLALRPHGQTLQEK